MNNVVHEVVLRLCVCARRACICRHVCQKCLCVCSCVGGFVWCACLVTVCVKGMGKTMHCWTSHPYLMGSSPLCPWRRGAVQ